MPVTRELATLNARRLRAVQLRVDGHSLAQVRAATGLSVPTIIKAYQAFKTGGWQAVAVAERGRPVGQGRALSATQEALLRWQALTQPPPGGGLWQRQHVQALAADRHGIQLDARTTTRLLERWGLALQSPLNQAKTAPAARAWLDAVWRPALAVARSSGARLLRAGALSHPDLAAPAGLWVVQSPRGDVGWLPVPHLATEAGALALLDAVVANNAASWQLFLHGPDLRRAPRVTTWLAEHPQLTLAHCPLAPTARRAAEPPPLAPPPLADDVPAPPLPRFTSLSPAPLTTEPTMNLTHLQRLEAESIHIMREVVAEADNPVMLYSIGKDSAVMLHLAKKAFFPSPPPFPLLHVDTTWKFRAMYEMRDRMAKELGMDLLVYHNPEAQAMGVNPFEHGSQIHTDMWKTQGLKQALDKYGFDVAFGGARRDEEKSRAKERIFSFRSAQHRWDPKNQRPELWRLYNGRKQKGESIRVFPISNWTELDIWQYILLENVPIVPLYFAAERPVVDRDGTLIMVDDDRFPLRDGEVPMMKKVRFRTLGCYPLSGAVESEADSLTAIIQEMLLTKTSERQGRMIDHDTAASMEKKKQEGYF